MKPRVVILSAFLTPFRSGAEACAEEMPLQLCDQFDFTIITARLRRDLPKEDMLQGKIPVKRIGFGFGFDKWLYPFLAPIEAKKYNPDIVHAILETFAGLALHFCRFTLPKTKRILTLQTTNRSFLKGMIIRSADQVTAISKYLADIAVSLGRNNVQVIRNGIDYDAIRVACEKNPKVPGRILFVGRLEKMKGVDLLLYAFAKLKTSHYILHIAGDGSQRHVLEKLAASLNVLDRVSFKGHLQRDNVYQEYAEAEIFCAPSRREALGNVFIEALAADCAVVGTDIQGIVEIVHAGATGFLVRPDASAIADTLQKLTDAKLRTGFIEEGRKSASQHQWNLIANRYAEIYKSITLL